MIAKDSAGHQPPEVLAAQAETLWAEISAKKSAGTLTAKDRMAIPPQEMGTRDPEARARQMEEVALGYTEAQARCEAERCLGCKNRPCMSAGFYCMHSGREIRGCACRHQNGKPAACNLRPCVSAGKTVPEYVYAGQGPERHP